MNVGPLGAAGSVAGSPLSQTRGADVDKAQQDTADQARRSQSQEKATQADGVGETQQEEEASDRDADGRRLWESPPETESSENDENQQPPPSNQSLDPSGQRGGRLDLSG